MDHMLSIEPLCSVISTGSISPIPSILSLPCLTWFEYFPEECIFFWMALSFFSEVGKPAPDRDCLCSTSDWVVSQTLSIPWVIPLLGTLAGQKLHQTNHLLWCSHCHTEHTITWSPVSSAVCLHIMVSMQCSNHDKSATHTSFLFLEFESACNFFPYPIQYENRGQVPKSGTSGHASLVKWTCRISDLNSQWSSCIAFFFLNLVLMWKHVSV